MMSVLHVAHMPDHRISPQVCYKWLAESPQTPGRTSLEMDPEGCCEEGLEGDGNR